MSFNQYDEPPRDRKTMTTLTKQSLLDQAQALEDAASMVEQRHSKDSVGGICFAIRDKARHFRTQAAVLPTEQQGEWVMVPMEPTPEMFDAGFNALEKQYQSEPLDDAVAKVSHVYRAMLSALPPPALMEVTESVARFITPLQYLIDAIDIMRDGPDDSDEAMAEGKLADAYKLAKEALSGSTELALNVKHRDCHLAADAFWAYWRENGETHKHGYYESTWGAINCALRLLGVIPHQYGRPKPTRDWIQSISNAESSPQPAIGQGDPQAAIADAPEAGPVAWIDPHMLAALIRCQRRQLPCVATVCETEYNKNQIALFTAPQAKAASAEREEPTRQGTDRLPDGWLVNYYELTTSGTKRNVICCSLEPAAPTILTQQEPEIESRTLISAKPLYLAPAQPGELQRAVGLLKQAQESLRTTDVSVANQIAAFLSQQDG